MWHIVIAEDLDDKFPAAPDTHLVEDRLQMILHGVRGDP
jgi:hypothetical protein